MHWEGKCWEHHYLIRTCLSKSRASHSRWWQLAWDVCTLHLKCRIANLYSSLCCLMPSPIPLPRLGSKSHLLQLVSATVRKSLEKATIGTDTSLWGIDTRSNVIYVCVVYVSVCLPLSRLEESPHKEILHQCRPDYRSERDQCQKAQSGVMRPNGETSRGLFNGNEYTMWAQGGMRGRVGESWPDWWGGRINHSVWERRGRCYVDYAHSGGSYLKTWHQQKEFAQLKSNVQIPTFFWELKGHFKVIDFKKKCSLKVQS